MKCHYEVLGIERDADDKTIKNGKKQWSCSLKLNSLIHLILLRIHSLPKASIEIPSRQKLR